LFGQSVGLVVDYDKRRRVLACRVTDAYDHVDGAREMPGELNPNSPDERRCARTQRVILRQMASTARRGHRCVAIAPFPPMRSSKLSSPRRSLRPRSRSRSPSKSGPSGFLDRGTQAAARVAVSTGQGFHSSRSVDVGAQLCRRDRPPRYRRRVETSWTSVPNCAPPATAPSGRSEAGTAPSVRNGAGRLRQLLNRLVGRAV